VQTTRRQVLITFRRVQTTLRRVQDGWRRWRQRGEVERSERPNGRRVGGGARRKMTDLVFKNRDLVFRLLPGADRRQRTEHKQRTEEQRPTGWSMAWFRRRRRVAQQRLASKTLEKTKKLGRRREGKQGKTNQGKGGGRRTSPPPLGQPQWAAVSLTGEEGKLC
jgi:hypothetical protein